MMKYNITAEKRYRRQYRLLEKRGYEMALLDDVVARLARGEVLPAKYQDHSLRGNRKGYRDCHVRGDWVLIYKLDEDILTLIL